MILYSWNVNGFRSAVGKGFWGWLRSSGGDVVCLQEIRVEPGQLEPEDSKEQGYEIIWNPSKVKRGYSGTACLCKTPPLRQVCGFPDSRFSGEGRIILLDYPQFSLLNVYFPNGGRDNSRVEFKLAYYEAFLEYAQSLRKAKPVVVCGDFNTAHREIDLKNPGPNAKRSGFLPQERAWLDRFVQAGYVDTFRMFNSEPGQYTWWSPMFKARAKNVGWRIDYFFVSKEMQKNVVRAWIEPEVPGSDHCPVGLELKF